MKSKSGASWRRSVIRTGTAADPGKARCGGFLPDDGERLIWHYDIPLVVLEHEVPLSFEGPLSAHSVDFNEAVDAMAKDLAHRSPKGQLRIAKESGHDIMLNEPSLVVQAVRDVWREAETSDH